MMNLTVLFTLLFSLSSFACEEMNLYETHPTINQLAIQNQGTLNTCYAQTLSTIYNMEPGTDKSTNVDPFWIAFVHKIDGLHWQPKKLDYSMLSLAYSDLQKSGACDMKMVNEAYAKLKNGVNYSNSQLFFLLSEYFKSKRSIDYLLYALPLKSKDDYEVPWTKADLEKILNPIAATGYQKSLFTWLKENVFANCEQNITQEFSDTLTNSARNRESNAELASLADELLAANKPVAMGICGKVFTYPDLRIKAQPRLLKAINTKCGAHYVTLVGSRKKGGSCEYLIRNSLGTGSWAHEDYTCYCKEKSTNQNRDCLKSELSNPDLAVLGCWIKQDTLFTNTFDLSYLNTF